MRSPCSIGRTPGCRDGRRPARRFQRSSPPTPRAIQCSCLPPHRSEFGDSILRTLLPLRTRAPQRGMEGRCQSECTRPRARRSRPPKPCDAGDIRASVRNQPAARPRPRSAREPRDVPRSPQTWGQPRIGAEQSSNGPRTQRTRRHQAGLGAGIANAPLAIAFRAGKTMWNSYGRPRFLAVARP